MPRAHIYKVLQNGDGSVLTGASVRVLADGASTNLTDPLFTTDAGSGVLTNPFTSTNGKIEFYLDNPQRVQIGITPPGSGEFFVTVDADPDALYQVVSGVPRLSLGVPVPGSYPHVNSSGQIEYVSIGTGITAADATPQVFLKDTSGATWALTVTTDGRLETTGEGSSSTTATTAVYFHDTSGATWKLTVDTTGHLVTESV